MSKISTFVKKVRILQILNGNINQMQHQPQIRPKTVEEAKITSSVCMARYMIARKDIMGGTVCDIACSAGYGSNYLSEKADKVYGIDIVQDAIDWANTHFKNNRIQFFNADITKGWPINTSFDVIVSHETIEHLTDPEKFVKEISDKLKHGGKLFLSLPNGPRDKARKDNPSHLQHFTAEEITSLIRKYFPNAEFFSIAYRKNCMHYLNKALVKLGLKNAHTHRVENYCLIPELHENLKNWYIKASK